MAEKETDKLLVEARKRFRAAQEWDQRASEQYLDDMRFLYPDTETGGQWPEEVKRERDLQHRPCLTINRLAAFVGQVVSDARQNTPTIQVHPVDDKSDPETAEILEGLIRQIEYQSNADQAYDTALEQSSGGGIGAFRIITDYAANDSFEQDIFIKRVTNPLTIHWDPAAREYDKSDAKWCFITELIDEEDFEARYPKSQKNDWGDGCGDNDYMLWHQDDKVRVAEYWCKKPVERKIALLETGAVVDLAGVQIVVDGEQEFAVVENQPVPIRRQRTVQDHEVVRYVLSGTAILEEEQDWAGKYIPIVMVYGPEVWLEGRVTYRSVHRYAQDAQRQYNYWSTTITEKIALAPKAPFIGTVANFEGLEEEWATANTDLKAYLPYNPDPLAQGIAPQRQQPAFVNAAEIQQLNQAQEDLKGTMGIFDASLGAQGNETSGRAIMARQREGDASTFPWLDNLSRSMGYAGRILIDLIPRIYDTERIVRVLGLDDKEEFVPINQQVYDPTTGQVFMLHDLAMGKYNVTVSTGPSYQTQRLEAADSLMQFIQAYPPAAPAAGDLIAKNMDWPGSEEFARRLKKMVPPQLLDPDDEDAPPPPPPNPLEILAVAEKEADVAKAQADIQKSAADTEGRQLENAQKQIELAAQTGQLEAIVEDQVRRTLLALLGPPPPQQIAPPQPGPEPGFFMPGIQQQ